MTRLARRTLSALAFLVAGAAAPLFAACQGPTLDLGSAASEAGSGSDASGSASGSLDGTWNGYVQSFQFADGDSTLRVRFTVETDGSTTGTIYLGSGPPLAPPADPDVGYPASYWAADAASALLPVEGIEYTVRRLVVAGGHVRFGMVRSEAWDEWCAIQKPTKGDGGSTCCRLADGGDGCLYGDPGKLSLCSGSLGFTECSCTPTACAMDAGAPDVSFDLQLTGDAFTGSVSGLNRYGVVYSVYLARAPR